MAKLAIKGHATRGSEVIALLEMMGGKNNDCSGKNIYAVYAIPNNGYIYPYQYVHNKYPDDFIIFTLEEFLEKFPYKVGDRIRHVSNFISGIIIKIIDMGYYIERLDGKGISYISFKREKDYELVPNKFDINTLVPFESRVLVRNTEEDIWKPAIFGCYLKDKSAPYYALGGICWRYCIPYGGNEYLLSTTNDCDNFYKTWEK